VKRVRWALIGIGVVLPLLAGCGSSSSPPFAVSCTVHRLPGGMLRASVKVTNSTARAGNAILYGPVFVNLRRFSPPILRPIMVRVKHSQGQTTYPGFILPRVQPKKPTHLFMRFRSPPRPQPIVTTNVSIVDAGDSDPLSNPDCLIGMSG
jgi:hypothetical protein